MTAGSVEAVWAWLYGTAARKATYGRFSETSETGGFSKDYLQVSGAPASLMENLFPPGPSNQHWLLLYSPGGVAERGFVSHSADRTHLAWEINRPPAAWRMGKSPKPPGPATIPGNPSRSNFTDALKELSAYAASGVKAYLVAVKLAGVDTGLHLRAYLENEPEALQFADVSQLPEEIRALLDALGTSRACVAKQFVLDDHLYFDPARNHDAWAVGAPPPSAPPAATEDAAAESLEVDDDELAALARQAATGDFSAPDVPITSKSRGSQQRVFANAVKENYGYRCALTGISTPEFLVASHIVPWAEDKMIRLDPANGICLSTLVDRAFDTGHLMIDVDYVAHVDQAKVGNDEELRAALQCADGKHLDLPALAPPKQEYLERRLAGFGVSPSDG